MFYCVMPLTMAFREMRLGCLQGQELWPHFVHDDIIRCGVGFDAAAHGIASDERLVSHASIDLECWSLQLKLIHGELPLTYMHA